MYSYVAFERFKLVVFKISDIKRILVVCYNHICIIYITLLGSKEQNRGLIYFPNHLKSNCKM